MNRETGYSQYQPPGPIWNRPGLDQIAYRIGTHSSFLEKMKAALSNGRFPSLSGLTTRESADPAIAFLDAWAMVADVLSFYQERIANEGYLRTAIERRSILELARLVGYQLRPGVAASTYLAYTLEKDSEVTIPAGSRAQSIPGPGEMPQSFETSDALPARAAWNNLKPRQTRPQILTPDQPTADNKGLKSLKKVLYFEGITTNLKPNDPLIFVYAEDKTEMRYVETVHPEPEKNRTQVTLQVPEPHTQKPPKPNEKGSSERAVSPIDRLSALVEPLVKSPAGHPPNAAHLRRSAANAFAPKSDTLPLLLKTLHPQLGSQLYKALEHASVTKPSEVKVYAPRVTASVFGHNAPLRPIFDDKGAMVGSEEWPLGDSTSISININVPLSRDQFLNANKTVRGRVLIREGNTTVTGQIPEAQLPLNGRTIHVEIKVEGERRQEPGYGYISINIRGYDPLRTINIQPADAELIVTINGSEDHHVHDGQSVRFSNQDDRISLNFIENKLAIRQESVLPLKEGLRELPLDAIYNQVTPHSWAIITNNKPAPYIARIASIKTISKVAFGLSGKVTQLTFEHPWLETAKTLSDVRNVSVHAQSEELKLAEEPIEEPIDKGTIELDGLYGELESGRWLIVEGERADVDQTTGVHGAELVMLASMEQDVGKLESGEDLPGDRLHTFLYLAEPLSYKYKRDTVVIHGNVVGATHGETKAEVLGSGDAAKSVQRFTLRQSPLTHVASSTPRGEASTLEVRINDVLWHEADALFDQLPNARVYITRTDDESKTEVVFGNGVRGARPSSGIENIKAVYRIGIGSSGNVAAQQISMLTTRPLGVKAVINPLRASGGADRESRDQARKNAPIGTKSLDRLVSLQDYVDFTRTFAGIGKACVSRLSTGREEVVHLTIAGENDIAIDEHSDLYRHLTVALSQLGDVRLPVHVDLCKRRLLVISANVRVLPDYLWSVVEPHLRAALLDAFSFERRDLGQDVFLSEVFGVMQAVEGVEYVDIDVFDTVGEPITESGLQRIAGRRQPPAQIVVRLARQVGKREVQPAEVAFLSRNVPDTLLLNPL